MGLEGRPFSLWGGEVLVSKADESLPASWKMQLVVKTHHQSTHTRTHARTYTHRLSRVMVGTGVANEVIYTEVVYSRRETRKVNKVLV